MSPDAGGTGSTPAFFNLFALDMQRVLVDEIKAYFSVLSPVPLDAKNLEQLRLYEEETPQAHKGLYILHHGESVCYVGKTDDSLFGRLSDHRAKIASRLNINPADMKFRALYLDKNWSALAHESALIDDYKALGQCSWNQAGFGLHDPGRERDTTEVKPDHFDRRFPVDPEFTLEVPLGRTSIGNALKDVKERLPYLLRFQTKHADLKKVIDINKPARKSTRSHLSFLVDALGESWQVTFLFGYVILYRESREYGPGCCQSFKVGGDEWRTPTEDPEAETDLAETS